MNGLSPPVFASLLHTAIEKSSETQTLWRLLGAANDYLRLHPGSLVLPKDPILAILHSRDANHRIIGLKCLIHSDLSFEEFANWILVALRSPESEERLGGLHALLVWYDVGNEVCNESAAVRNELLSELHAMPILPEWSGMKDHAIGLVSDAGFGR